MGTYRKKPIEIEAFRVAEGIRDAENLPDWAMLALKDGTMGVHKHDRAAFEIRTLEGVMVAMPGDWIIKGVAGELYPCKPHIFEATYDKVA